MTVINFLKTFHFGYTSVTMYLQNRKVSKPKPTLSLRSDVHFAFKMSRRSIQRVTRPRGTQSSEKCFAKLQEMGRVTTSVSLLASI